MACGNDATAETAEPKICLFTSGEALRALSLGREKHNSEKLKLMTVAEKKKLPFAKAFGDFSRMLKNKYNTVVKAMSAEENEYSDVSAADPPAPRPRCRGRL